LVSGIVLGYIFLVINDQQEEYSILYIEREEFAKSTGESMIDIVQNYDASSELSICQEYLDVNIDEENCTVLLSQETLRENLVSIEVWMHYDYDGEVLVELDNWVITYSVDIDDVKTVIIDFQLYLTDNGWVVEYIDIVRVQ
jgi:hypothetical protein